MQPESAGVIKEVFRCSIPAGERKYVCATRSVPGRLTKLRMWCTSQKQMGHARVSITHDRYSHLINKRRPDAATLTEAKLFGKSATN